MPKRVLSVLIVLSMLLGILCINVNANDYITENTQLDILKALEIVCGYHNEEGKIFSVMKKSTFVNFLLNMTEGGKYTAGYDEEALATAQGFGIIDDAKSVQKGDVLKREEAIKMVMCFLGYGEICRQNGGYPIGYTAKALNLGITKGYSLSDEVTNAQAYKLLYNTMRTGITEPVTYGDSITEYVTYDNKTILNVYRKIYEIKGTVTANRTSGLYEEKASAFGYSMINEEQYSDPNELLYDYLGYNVLAYAKRITETEYEIIYAEKDDKVSEIHINSENIKEIGKDVSSIEYYTDDDSDKTDTVTIPKTVPVLYNNAVWADYSEEDFKKPNGVITLINNDGKGDIDVIKMDYYQTMIVSSVSSATGVITNEYTFEGSLEKLELDKYKKNGDNIIFYKDGELSSIADVKKGDVLSVFKSLGGKNKSITIYITRKTANMEVTSYNAQNKEIVCENVIYKVSDIYYEALKNNESFTDEITVGTRYVFLFDMNNKIAATRVESADTIHYAYVKDVTETGELNSGIICRAFTEYGEWKTISFAQKVRINGGKPIKAKDAYSIIATIRNTIIGYAFDENGNINRLEVATEYNPYEQNPAPVNSERLNVTAERTDRYRTNNNSLDNNYYMLGSTVLFFIPVSNPENEDLYNTGDYSLLSSDESVTYRCYGCDEYGFAKAVAVYRDASTSKKVGTAFYFVRDVSKVVNEEGAVTGQITVSSAAYFGLSILADNEERFNNVKPGDIIKIHVNGKGYVDNVEHVYKVADGIVKESPSNLHDYTYAKGVVKQVDSTRGAIILESTRSSSDKTMLKVSPTVSVLVFDETKGTINQGSLMELSKGDFVIADVARSSVRGLYVIYFKNKI